MATNALLDLSALNAVTSYEPNELIITVQAGAPLADVVSLIDSRNQHLAFEPVNTARLLGTADIGTIGGMIGAGLAGPRRIKAGGARDHLLGAHAVSGFGDSFKAGGKVVKNVTGYDLCKLLAGSWGTLAVMTEVTLKVMPRPESERTLVLRGLDDLAANRAMTAALGSPFDVSGGGASAECGACDRGRRTWRSRIVATGGDAAAAGGHCRFRRPSGGRAGCRAGAVWQRGDVGRCGLGRDLGCGPRRSAVRSRRHARIVAGMADRLSAGLGRCARRALARDTGGTVIYDWGGGLIWAALPPDPQAHATLVRGRVDAAGGHATLLRASEQVRRHVDVFHPQPSGLAALGERVRHSFDPKNILNRGRMTRAPAA